MWWAIHCKWISLIYLSGGAAEEVEEVKAEDLTELVNISTILTEDFYKDLQSTNWSDCKKSLDTLDDKSTTPKIAEGDFGELISILKRVIED